MSALMLHASQAGGAMLSSAEGLWLQICVCVASTAFDLRILNILTRLGAAQDFPPAPH